MLFCSMANSVVNRDAQSYESIYPNFLMYYKIILKRLCIWKWLDLPSAGSLHSPVNCTQLTALVRNAPGTPSCPTWMTGVQTQFRQIFPQGGQGLENLSCWLPRCACSHGQSWSTSQSLWHRMQGLPNGSSNVSPNTQSFCDSIELSFNFFLKWPF